MNPLHEKNWQALPASEVLTLLDVDARKGLDLFEVKHRTDLYGRNILTPRKGKSPLVRFLLQFKNPLVLILIAAATVAAVLKDITDAAVIFGVVLINSIISYIQEARAEEAIAALSKTMTAEAFALRAGKVVQLPASELVPGDIVKLTAGVRVPADLRLVESRDLQVIEAALTGESVAVEKDSGLLLPQDSVLAERRNMTYASTLVTYGTATGVVIATGDYTEVGRISQLISSAAELVTPLTRKISQFSNLLLVVILALSALIFGVGVLRGQGVVDTLMAAIALAVGAIPEGLPAAVTVILAVGVSRMARRKAIIRNLPAVETLGSTTVICSDKTGTLTQNQMTVQEIHTLGGAYAVSGTGYQPQGTLMRADPSDNAGLANPADDLALIETLKAGLLCNDSQLVESEGRWTVQGDPTEGALLTAAHKGLPSADLSAYPARVDSIPFDSQHQFMATLHADGMVYVKGAAEVLLERCSGVLDPSGQISSCQVDIFRQAMEKMASQGLRVLAFARLEKPGASSLSFADISGLTILGLQGMMDPPRPEAVDAVRACQSAGITVKMITGDHALTAAAIGMQIGLCRSGCEEVLTGAQLALLTDAQLIEKVGSVNVFARVSPEQKLRLVEALQARGHVVAMTGDGVNDAPALKQSNIGIAMGITGTDVSKEAADMILTDDNFATIEAAVEEGRGVFDNLIKFIVWALPTNLGEAMVMLAAIVTGAALPILPVQLLWINMVSAGILGLTLAVEPKESDLMSRTPRDQNEPILNRVLIWRIAMVSLIILAGAFGLFEYELIRGATIEEARTVAVNVVIFVGLLYLFNARSLKYSPFQIGFFSNPWAVGGAVLMTLVQIGYTYLPFMNDLFGSAPMPLVLWLDVIAVSIAAFVLVEIEKWLRRKRQPTGQQVLPVVG